MRGVLGTVTRPSDPPQMLRATSCLTFLRCQRGKSASGDMSWNYIDVKTQSRDTKHRWVLHDVTYAVMVAGELCIKWSVRNTNSECSTLVLSIQQTLLFHLTQSSGYTRLLLEAVLCCQRIDITGFLEERTPGKTWKLAPELWLGERYFGSMNVSTISCLTEQSSKTVF